MRKIVGIRDMTNKLLKHSNRKGHWGLFPGTWLCMPGESVCVWLDTWQYTIKPFFIQVTNPLLFPICSVLYQFQANASLAIKVIRPVSLVCASLYKEMWRLRSEKAPCWTAFIQCTVSSDVWCEVNTEYSVFYFGLHFLESFCLERFSQDVYLLLFDWSLKDPQASALVVPTGAALTHWIQEASQSLCLRLCFGQSPNHLLWRISGIKQYLL